MTERNMPVTMFTDKNTFIYGYLRKPVSPGRPLEMCYDSEIHPYLKDKKIYVEDPQNEHFKVEDQRLNKDDQADITIIAIVPGWVE